MWFGRRVVRVLCPRDAARWVDEGRLLRDESAPEPPYWVHLWPGARVLAQRLWDRVTPGVRVLELGCGLGLPSLAAAAAGGWVVAIDHLAGPLRLLAESARRSTLRVNGIVADWRSVPLRGKLDLCVGADIAYDRASAADLAATVHSCLRPGGRLLLADSVNVHDDAIVRALEACGLRIRQSELREWDDGHAVWVRLLEGESG